MIGQPALRRRLIALLATSEGARADGADALRPEDWRALDRLAAAHRLQPLLHALHRDDERTPADVRAGWRAAHRRSAMLAMTHRADLVDTVAVLRAAGIEPLALKGAWLAWQTYPEPAQRPLRDIDLLVPTAAVLVARDALLAAGYREIEKAELTLAGFLAVDKSLPELIAPRGTPIELHFHAWLRSGALDYPSPPPDDDGLFARSRIGPDGIRYPGATDMLAHLVVHAVYSHRLDCGPLLVPDIDLLIRREPIDWQAFWDRAAANGSRRGAQLVLALVERLRATPGIDWREHRPGEEIDPLLAEAPDLLLQDHDTRLSAGLAVRLGARGLRGTLSGLRDTVTGRVATVDGVSAGRRFGGPIDFLRWAWSRLVRSAGQMASREVRAQARTMARLTRFISRDD